MVLECKNIRKLVKMCLFANDAHHTVSRTIQTLVRVSITATGNTFSQKQPNDVSVVTWGTCLQQETGTVNTHGPKILQIYILTCFLYC